MLQSHSSILQIPCVSQEPFFITDRNIAILFIALRAKAADATHTLPEGQGTILGVAMAATWSAGG